MNLWQAFKMSFRSLWGNKGRSFLTMLGIIIGIAAVMTIVSVLQGMNKRTMEQFEAMGTNTISLYAYSYNGVPVFDQLYEYCLQLGDQVVGVSPQSYVWAENVSYGVKSSQNMEGNLELLMVGHQYSLCANFTLAQGRDLTKTDIDSYSSVCVLGYQAARNFFDMANPVGKTIMVDGVPFTVVGVYGQKDTFNDPTWSMDNIIAFPYTAARALGHGDQETSNMLVKAKDSNSSTEVATKISGFLKGLLGDPNDPNSSIRGDYYVQSDASWQEQSNEMLAMMTLILGGIAGISLLVGGIGIMNIMLVTVTERTREIGIRRAIGARRKSIVTQFLIEAGVICGVGGVIGIGLGAILTAILSKNLLGEMLWPAPSIGLIATGFSVTLGIVFGLYPAIKASGLQPVVALRAE